MEPLRGSNRTATKTPALKNKKKPAALGKTEETEHPNSYDNNLRKKHPKAGQKRKAESSSSVPKRAKGQENWMLIPRSSITLLENIMDWSILATLALKRKGKNESQEHLNIIKNRFLAQCAQLKVPAQTQRYVEPSSHRHQEETKNSAVGQTTLSNLTGDLRAVVSALERIEEQTEALQHTCTMLKNQVEEEEKNAEEILQISEQSVLHLPSLCPQKEDITLEAQMQNLTPDSVAETTARELGEILQGSQAIRDARALLLEAHKHADRAGEPLPPV
ncbi:centromere protein Q [Antennarius striatus]|uniref:centromere protein Q n=1 Tax=Antennarius striatus TaxID=241820 RepID=UPI0035B376F0